MYNYNNKDRHIEEGLSEWYDSVIGSSKNTHPHRRERDFSSIINKIIKLIPTISTQGKSKFHS